MATSLGYQMKRWIQSSASGPIHNERILTNRRIVHLQAVTDTQADHARGRRRGSRPRWALGLGARGSRSEESVMEDALVGRHRRTT